jgi:hypothetical protein
MMTATATTTAAAPTNNSIATQETKEKATHKVTSTINKGIKSKKLIH